jgi:hypothetical protein
MAIRYWQLAVSIRIFFIVIATKTFAVSAGSQKFYKT